MTWSLTARLYMAPLPPSGITHEMAKRTAGIARQPCHGLRQIVEGAFAGDEPIENRIGEEIERESKAAAMRPARALRPRHCAHLRGAQRQAPRMEILAKRHR